MSRPVQLAKVSVLRVVPVGAI